MKQNQSALNDERGSFTDMSILIPNILLYRYIIIGQDLFYRLMQSSHKENLKQFKITYNAQFIQVEPLIPFFKTQILINKKTGSILFQKKGKPYAFPTQTQIVYSSLILGVLKIKQSNFLLYAENVYQQPTFGPKGISVYQIASVQFVPFKFPILKQQQSILQTLKSQIFNFSFYYSFDTDLTQRTQIQYSKANKKPVSNFFWNQNLLNNLFQDKHIQQWKVPIIQGYYGKFQTHIDKTKITYYLISRRSKERSGTRFYSRGIDENGNCSNFIETEQIIHIGKYIMSAIFLSGSSPVFWEQKSQTKPIRLTRNKQLTKGPFIDHLTRLNSQYQYVFLFNLLEKKKQGQNLLIKAFEQMLSQNAYQIDGFCRYAYFDINDSIKKKSISQIVDVVNKVDKIIDHFNCFIYNYQELKVVSKQGGVFRVSCLDCLNRTNVLMQAIAIKTLALQLKHADIAVPSIMENLLIKPFQQLDTLSKNFKTLWLGKADYESLIYAGTRAVSGLKNKFLDDIDSSFVSLQRLYNQKFMDRIKQTAIDLVHTDHKGKVKPQNLNCQYTSSLNICISTWNVNATSPEKLNVQQLAKNFEDVDLIVFGIQEMIELQANNVMLEQEQTKRATLWQKNIMEHLKTLYGPKFIFVQKIQMVGICLIIFINQTWKSALKSVHKDTVKTGMGGNFGNKGGAVMRVNIFDTSLCFTCAHLAAGKQKFEERLDDFQQIHKKAFQQNKSGIINQSDIESSDHKFFFGDLNFRIEGQFKDFTDLMQLYKKEETPQYNQQMLKIVLKYVEKDQLFQVKMNKDAKLFISSYIQQQITFLPTYKLEKSTGRYTTEKNRNPSWCDRILYWPDDLESHSCQCTLYTSVNVTGSDHRPVIGKFSVSILKQEPKELNPLLGNNDGKGFRDTFFES